MAGDVRDIRTRSSIAVGVGPSNATMRLRSSSPGLVVERACHHALRFLRRQIEAAAEDRFEQCNDIGGFRDQGRALLEQPVGTLGAGVEWGAGHRENFAALFAGEPRRDQGAGAARRFYDDHADRQA